MPRHALILIVIIFIGIWSYNGTHMSPSLSRKRRRSRITIMPIDSLRSIVDTDVIVLYARKRKSSMMPLNLVVRWGHSWSVTITSLLNTIAHNALVSRCALAWFRRASHIAIASNTHCKRFTLTRMGMLGRHFRTVISTRHTPSVRGIGKLYGRFQVDYAGRSRRAGRAAICIRRRRRRFFYQSPPALASTTIDLRWILRMCQWHDRYMVIDVEARTASSIVSQAGYYSLCI